MKNRLSRIIKPKDKRTLMLAVDHGYFMGPTTGLENFEIVKKILPYADAIMLTRGALRNYIPAEEDIPIVLRVSGGTSIIGKELLHEGIITSIKDAIRLNVSSLAFSIMVGSEFERDTLLGLAKIVDFGEQYSIPVVAVTAVGKDMARDARYLALASRIAAEFGAHIVKTYYCENFEKVVESCPVPIVIAGGKKVSEEEALKITYNAIKAGAAGVDMGRNIFQAENPKAMIQAIRAIVHENFSAKEAIELFEKLKKEKK